MTAAHRRIGHGNRTGGISSPTFVKTGLSTKPKGPNPTFSPEGKLAYVGVREGKTQLVVDAEPVAEAEDGFSSLVFSSTGKLAILEWMSAARIF